MIKLQPRHINMITNILADEKLIKYIASKRDVTVQTVRNYLDRFIISSSYMESNRDCLNEYRTYYMEYKQLNK